MIIRYPTVLPENLYFKTKLELFELISKSILLGKASTMKRKSESKGDGGYNTMVSSFQLEFSQRSGWLSC